MMYDRAPINEWFRPRLRIPEEGRAELELVVRKDFYHAAARFMALFISKLWMTLHFSRCSPL